MSTITEGQPSSGDSSAADESAQKQSQATTMQEAWEQLSDDARKTWIFAAVALVCLLITGLFELASRPASIEEYGKVGQEFYPDFKDPTMAKSLSVKVVDADELRPMEFSVKQSENGRWVIPSHHNYPADAAEQLADTASSVIGITRGAMVTRWPADHANYGVVDPDTDSVGVDEIEGIGKRISLLGGDDAVLASYIIGKAAEDQEGQYYVRHPAEDEVYIADLDISLSTKFSDWVKTDLLDIQNFDVRRVVLNDYSFEERGLGLALTETVVSELSRESSSGDWSMDGIDPITQEVDADAMRETVNAVADLALAGVRPKQEGLTADLQLDLTKIRSQRDVDRIRSDLLARGFLLQPTEENPKLLELISREGEMLVGTEDGLVYRLHFGRVFTGSDEELEIGLSGGDEEAAAETNDADENAADESGNAESGEDEADDTDSGKPGRYIFVRVVFDESLLGEKPNPVEPQKSEELKEAEKKAAEKAASEEEGEEASDEASSEQESDDGEEADDEQAAEEEESDEAKLQRLQQEFELAKQQYNDDVKALEEHNKKVSEGKEKAVELNRRFAQWYYVIPGESYDKLSLSREDLIKEKEKAEEEQPDAAGGPSIVPPIGLTPPQVNRKPAEESAEQPKDEPADKSKEEPKKEEAPAEEPKDESAEEPKDEPAEDPKEDPKEEPVDEPKEAADEPEAEPEANPDDESSNVE